jgi:hypothetical protein
LNSAAGGARALFIGAALVACVQTRAAENPAQPVNDLSARGPFVVDTLEFRDLTDAARGRKVPIKVHLPTRGGPFPVVIVSHGGGGHWDANFAQAQHLASYGYVVLAVEHVGSNTEVMKRSLRFVSNLEAMTRDANEVLGRPKDISSSGSKHVMLPSRSRSEVQPVVRAATLLFFNAYLKGDASARQSLTAAALEPYRRGGADGVEVLNK